LELELAKFDLPLAVENAIMLVRERATRHGVSLYQEVDKRLGEFVGDERKIKQILLNLLSNAVKFTSEGRLVLIGLLLRDQYHKGNSCQGRQDAIKRRINCVRRSEMLFFIVPSGPILLDLDDQIELRWLLHRQLCRPRTLQDFVDVSSCTTI